MSTLLIFALVFLAVLWWRGLALLLLLAIALSYCHG